MGGLCPKQGWKTWKNLRNGKPNPTTLATLFLDSSGRRTETHRLTGISGLLGDVVGERQGQKQV